jgi:hypothetical protein
MEKKVKFLSDSQRSRFATRAQVSRYRSPLSKSPTSTENEYISLDSRYKIPGSIKFPFVYPRGSGSNDCSADAWINTVTAYNSIVTSTLDGNCSMYSYQNSGNQHNFLKFDLSGNLLWEKTYNLLKSNQSFNSGGTNITIDKDGYPYFTSEHGIIKLDPNNGDIIWNKFWGQLDYPYISGVVIDSLGNLIISSVYTGDNYTIAKINSSTGELINQIQFAPYPDTIGTAYLASNSATDSSGNIYFPTAHSETTYGYHGTIFKFDTNLSVLSAKQIDPSVYTTDTDIIGFGVDLEGNSYISGYGTVLYKLNSVGELAWAYTMDTAAGSTNQYIEFFANNNQTGDVFWIISNDTDVWDPNGNNDEAIAVIKFDKDGNYLWATEIKTIEANTGMYLDWFEITSCTRCENNTLLISAWSYNNNTNIDHFSYIKMSANEQTTGTFGDYILTDVTSLFLPQTFVAESISSPYSTDTSTMFDNSNLLEDVICELQAPIEIEIVNTPIT